MRIGGQKAETHKKDVCVRLMWDDLTVQNQFAFYRPDSEVVLLYTAMILLCRRPSHTKLNDRLPGKTLSSTSVFALPIGIEKGLIRFTDCKRLGPARPAHIVITFVAHPHLFSIADGMTAPITDVANRIAGNHHGVLFGALGRGLGGSFFAPAARSRASHVSLSASMAKARAV